MGYKRALEKYNLTDNEMIIECSSNDEENRHQIRNFLQKEKNTDGIFAAVEKLAINTYQVCHELKINIPQNIKVISFSNLAAVALFDPPLSTIVQPAYEIGKEATTILFKIIENKMLLPTEKRITIPSHIVERRSTSK
jgi:LacI family transcriptional regulator